MFWVKQLFQDLSSLLFKDLSNRQILEELLRLQKKIYIENVYGTVADNQSLQIA